MKSFLSLWAFGLFCLANLSYAQPIPLHGQRLTYAPPAPLHPPQQDLESDFPQPVELVDHFFEVVIDGNADKVQMLLDAGVDPNTIKGVAITALSIAAYGGHVKIVQMLIDAGAKLDPAQSLWRNSTS